MSEKRFGRKNRQVFSAASLWPALLPFFTIYFLLRGLGLCFWLTNVGTACLLLYFFSGTPKELNLNFERNIPSIAVFSEQTNKGPLVLLFFAL